ncbi:pilus assembly PilX N-terminal domain-containing protein, partial [Patescibacteria group bacterium]|nr:pilus assembly PilX N-terminal domain-containing protein [Patescibacteria group bacterium]
MKIKNCKLKIKISDIKPAMNMLKKLSQNNNGNVLLVALVFGFVSFSIIVTGVTGYAILENRASVRKHNREMAFQIAEAGIDYYRWHLAHDQTDYQDGTENPGPYVHEYKNKDGVVIGHFSLNIIPPANGSTIVVVESTGWLDAQPESARIIRARIGFPSLTDYSFLTNTDVWIGDSEVVHGKFHANGGIRFDGTTDAELTSAMATYTCKSFHGCGNQTKPGIWGDGGPTDYWQFPVPAFDFDAITLKLANIKEGAQNGGLYLTSSGQQGWRLEFLANGTINVQKVTATNCYKGKDVNENDYEWFCVDVKTLGTATNYPMPGNNYIYVEDMVWVDGTVNGRVTVGTATGKSIIINGNILYQARDGNHSLGLIAEQNILVPHDSPDDLEMDGVFLAQKGAAKRYYYPGDTKDSLSTFGSLITAGIWTWSWVSGGGSIVSGYETISSVYDSNLTYNPPPGFPVGQEYKMIS